MPFSYPQPQPNPYVASISDLLLRQGDIAGQGALVNAQRDVALANIKAQELSSIASAAGNIVPQIQQAQAAKQKALMNDQSLQAGALELAQKQKAASDADIYGKIIAGAYGQLPSQQPGFSGPTQQGLPQAGELPPGFEKDASGVITPSMAFVQKGLAAAGLGAKIPEILTEKAKSDKSIADLLETKGKIAVQTQNALGALGAQTQASIDHGLDPTVAFHINALTALSNGIVTPQQLKPYVERASDPTQIPSILAELQKGSPEQTKLNSEALTAAARMKAANTGQFSEAGITQQLAEAALGKGGTVQTIPPPVTPSGIPGAVGAVAPPANINQATGQPIVAPEPNVGGPVNPIAPQMSPASPTMTNTLPPAAPEPVVLSPAEAALAAHAKVKEAGMKAAAERSPQIKSVMLDGKPAEVLMKPDGTFTDLSGNAIENAGAHIKPIPPASVQVNNQIAGQFKKTDDPYVKAIAEYRSSPPSARQAASPAGKALMDAVLAENPDYDASKFSVRAPTRKAFTTGPQGQQITAMNTAIEHLDQLQAASDALKNGNFVPGNDVYNRVVAMFGGSAPTNYDAIKTLLNKEVEAVANKGVPTVSGTAEQKALASSSAGPKQIKDFIDTMIPLMGSKLNALTYAYKQAMGEKDPFNPLTPEAQSILSTRGFSGTGSKSGGLVPTLRFNPATGKTEPVQ